MLDHLLETPDDGPNRSIECPNCLMDIRISASDPLFSCIFCKECFDFFVEDFDPDKDDWGLCYDY